jgi:hypothetical protein
MACQDFSRHQSSRTAADYHGVAHRCSAGDRHELLEFAVPASMPGTAMNDALNAALIDESILLRNASCMSSPANQRR